MRSLACLPIFVAGCKQMVALVGCSYTSRLWCATELFCLVRIHLLGGESLSQRLVLLPLDDVDIDVGSLFGSFDVRSACCFLHHDRQRLLAIIEASFGDLGAFNHAIRRISPALVAAAAERRSAPMSRQEHPRIIR